MVDWDSEVHILQRLQGTAHPRAPLSLLQANETFTSWTQALRGREVDRAVSHGLDAQELCSWFLEGFDGASI